MDWLRKAHKAVKKTVSNNENGRRLCEEHESINSKVNRNEHTEERREKMLNAASTRHNEWNDKLKARKRENIGNTKMQEIEEIDTNEEELHKQRNEAERERTIQELGYDPYQTVLSGCDAARSQIVMNGSHVETTTETRTTGIELLQRQNKETLGMTLPCILRILNNLRIDLSNPKYRRLRMNNETIEKRIINIPGALDVLYEIGFTETIEDQESRILFLDDNAYDFDKIVQMIDQLQVLQLEISNRVN